MKIGFIGAGKVGFSLGKYFTEHNLCVCGYYSRNLNSAKEAATFTNTKYYKDLKEIIQECDTLFLTVPDGCISEVYSKIIQSDIAGKYLVHCSGALSSKIFCGIRERGAQGSSIHPICAVSDKLTGYHHLSKAYFTIEGEDVTRLKDLLCHCGNPVEEISAEQKVKYHAAAVFASNLVVGLFDMSTRLLQECGLSEDFASHALHPLFKGNAENTLSMGTIKALTGPVERADIQTVRNHLITLSNEQRMLYRLLSKQLIRIAEQKNPGRNYQDIYTLLENDL